MKAEKNLFHHHFLRLVIFLRLFFISLSSDGLAGDSHRLLSFKNSLPHPDQLGNWQPTLSPCHFNGVSCNNSRVSSVNLSNHNLNANFFQVAFFLLPLQNLESLVLKNANISGAIRSPSKFSCSSYLNSLDLAENTISGPISDVSTLKVCPSLVFLNLSGNIIDPFDMEVDGVSGLASLHVLDLSDNKIFGDDVVSWILSDEFPQLLHLSLKGNKVSGSLPELNLKNLMYLDLSFNNFSTRFPVLNDCSNLRYLDFSSNKFFGDVETSFSACPKLNFLNLTNNQLTGTVPKLLPLGSLQFVYLKQNHFHGVFPLTCSDSCSSLLELDLSVNNLTGTLPETLAECFALEVLDVSSNNFSGELPVDTLLKLSSLKVLKMSFNNFVGPLPDSMSRLVNLESLDLSSNSLSGFIPSGLCQDPTNTLKVLYLQNNLFTGAIPHSLSNCSHLASLDLSFNSLTGTIPPSLGSLSELKDLMMLLNELSGEIPSEFMYLQSLENLLLDFNYLTGSIPASLSNCTKLNWISLSNNRLSGEIPSSLGSLVNLAILKLDNNSLSGRIPGELGDCRSLIWLDLNTNLLNGNIPPPLFKQSGYIDVALLTGKRYVYIKNNGSKQCHGAGNLLEFGGVSDEKLDRVSSRHSCSVSLVWRGITQPNFNHNGSMIFLDLSYNELDGGIPKELGSMYYLFVLNLGHNDLSGAIPDELGGLKTVAILDLSYNKLNGTIPQSLTSLRLGDIDLSNNHLSGTIPESAPLDTFPDYRFVNNSGLCGYPLPPCGSFPLGSNSERLKSNRRKQVYFVGSIAVGIAFSLFCILGPLIVIAKMKQQRRKLKEAALEAYIDNHSNSGTVWKISAREALTISLATFDDQKPLRKLTFADLLEATNGFHSDALVGSGGFGDVYKAVLRDGSVVAVKKLKHVSGQGDREFTAEMETIGRVKHRNLVPLLGYCKVREERLLVYEYMKYGSLEDVLQDRKKIGITLGWPARRRIALGAARGLTFLHHTCNPHIIHRDMKSSNVLLDEDLEARVSDFGMARMMSAVDTHLSVSTLAGTPGYVPPEYYQSFRCTTNGDVYSYGVVLLELLTGRRPTGSSDFGDDNIVGWMKQHPRVRISDVFDPLLMKQDPTLEVELLQHLNIARACLDDRPWKRPTMIQVMAAFKQIQAPGSQHHSASLHQGIQMTTVMNQNN